MSKVKWFNRDDLVDLALPAIAGSMRGVLDQANREGWLWRPREGRGGGREYHISSLPEAARIELARRAIAKTPMEHRTSSAADISPPSGPLSPSSLDSGFVATGEATSPPAGTSFPLARFATSAPQTADGRGGKAFLSATRPASRAQIRCSARTMIVGLVKLFAEAGGLSMIAARANFAHLFNAGEIAVEPWVKAEVGRLTVRSIERWTSQLARHGAQRLAGRYGHRKGKGQIECDAQLRDFCVAQMAANAHLSAKGLGDRVKARFGLTIAKRTLQRFMSGARAQHANLFLTAQNPDAWKNQRLVAFGSLSEAVTAPNARWEADASPADIILLDPEADGGRRRYHLIGNIDVWSRRVKILVTETPKSTATMCVIRRSIMDWGVPQLQKTDNGKDFVSAYCVRAFAALQIEHRPCAPFSPEGKPHIERFFHTLQHDLIATLPGFIGHNVADRKAIEARRSFADRLGEKDALIEVSLTRDELQARIDDWLAHDYHARHHEGLGTSPRLKTMEWTGPIARIENERALDILLAEAPDTAGLRVVGKKGLRVENALFIAPDLALHIGERVQVRLDPDDMGQIVVYTIEGDFVCVAKCPERTGIDRREVAVLAKHLQKQDQRDLKARLAAAKRDYRLGDLADEVAAMKREEAASIIEFPRANPTENYDTPMLAAAALAARRLAGIETPRPLTDEERALAAEGMAALDPESEDDAASADIISLPERQAATTDAVFSDDWKFYLHGLAHRSTFTAGQMEIWEELHRSPSIQIRLQAMREAESAS